LTWKPGEIESVTVAVAAPSEEIVTGTVRTFTTAAEDEAGVGEEVITGSLLVVGGRLSLQPSRTTSVSARIRSNLMK